MNRAVFLDRDGVINRARTQNNLPIAAKSLSELEILPGVLEGVAILANRGFELVIVTNQPDVARGNLKKEAVEEIHSYLSEKLGIKHFYTCFHDDSDQCACRKPRPGLLADAAEDLNIDLSRSFMIGDRWRDIGAGQAVGCQCIFIDASYSERRPQSPFTTVLSLLQAAQLIMEAEVDKVTG